MLLIVFDDAIDGRTAILNQFKVRVSHLSFLLHHWDFRLHLVMHMHFIEHE